MRELRDSTDECEWAMDGRLWVRSVVSGAVRGEGAMGGGRWREVVHVRAARGVEVRGVVWVEVVWAISGTELGQNWLKRVCQSKTHIAICGH